MIHLKNLCSILLALIAFSSAAQPFEGRIEFKFYTPIDTIHFIYHEKNGLVKIEEYSYDKRLRNFILLDLNRQKATAFYPERQVFYTIENYFSGNKSSYDLKLDKGKKVMEVAGQECQEYVVKSKLQNMTATYYTISSPFDFTKAFIPALQKKDKIFKYYLQFAEFEGMLPLYAVETGPAKSQRFAFEIFSIQQISLEDQLFAFPEGYTIQAGR